MCKYHLILCTLVCIKGRFTSRVCYELTLAMHLAFILLNGTIHAKEGKYYMESLQTLGGCKLAATKFDL